MARPTSTPEEATFQSSELNMKKFAATIFLTVLIAVTGFSQSPPTLRIVTETPGLPSELFYGNIKVKPLRLRPGTNTPITIADYDFFIAQQYIDFLRRFPEPAGMQFYLNILNGCQNTDTECIKFTRGALSANFFRSPEFQRKGSYVMYLYMTSLGQRPATVAELNDASKLDRPHYAEFMADLATISVPDDDPVLGEQKKVQLTDAWMQRTEVKNKYDPLSNSAFVQTLLNTAGVTLPSQAQLVADLNANTRTRAQVLRIIAESTQVNDKFYKQAFVTMEYFGYLRRDPEICVGNPNPSQCGYIFHNERFQLSADPDFLENTIVRGFIESPEYINRF
jgi:hypothetical protein